MDEEGPHGPEPWADRRRWFRRPAVVVGVAVVAVALVAGAVLLVRAWGGRGADEASVEESVEGFRESGGDGGGEALLRPAAGVYTYEAEGTEELSVLGTSQAWGSTIPATVTHGEEGCWTIRLEFSTNHAQSTTYCPRDRVLEEVAGSTTQTFDFVAVAVTDVTDFTCDPPGEVVRLDADPGDSWEQACIGRSPERGTEVTSSGTNTFLGVEELEVGGRTVEALHHRYDRTLSGDQSGTDTHEGWYDPSTGMLLAGTRDTSVTSPSPLGDVRYTERGRFTLTSTDPRT